ncbi:MAG TPA: fibronectin type III domain-containing protein [Patescibacteria group bacterium]|nr:fibronectin type III domain-containing protein [Patescibacteria group bacterium]
MTATAEVNHRPEGRRGRPVTARRPGMTGVLLAAAAFILLVAAGGATAVLGGADDRHIARQVRLGLLDPGAPLPADLLHAEGKSRWELKTATIESHVVRTFSEEAGVVTVTDDGSAPSTRVYSDPAGGDAAVRWLLPDRDTARLKPGARATLVLDEENGGAVDRLRIETQTVGIGWVELPSGPHEVVLERALVLREAAGKRGFAPDRLVHRFIDPKAGVVAEIAGPPSADGRSRATVAEAALLEVVIQGAGSLIIHSSELWDAPLTVVNYGRDRGNGTTVASLTPAPGVSTMGDLIALDSWDFSGDNSGVEIGFTSTPVNSAETCNYAQCGYTTPGVQLERSDKNFDVPASWQKVNDVAQLEDRVSDSVIWLRAGSQKEGVTGSFGNGESRFCYTGTWTDSMSVVHTRVQVPLWILAHQDAQGRYFQIGDTWTSAPFNCDQNVYNGVCGDTSGLFSTLYAKACNTHTGTQNGAVLKGGVVTTPSGHTFNALLVRNVADFCVFSTAACGSLAKLSEVRTVNYLWQVPHLGTVARVQSAQNVADNTSFTTLAETDFKFGLFPPRSITVGAVADTTIDLTWDPGLDTHRISGYKVYWDTDPGAATAYAFNSQSNPGQVAFAGAGATISGLTPGTTYYLTVTALSTFTDPSTLVPRTYESILYPTQVSGDPSFIYPVEVQAHTTGGVCIPTAEVTGLTVVYDPAGIRICWNPVTDPCLVGYQVLGAASPQAAANFAPVADVGLVTCWAGNPASSFFLVTAAGTGGHGPWGHYGL